MTTTIWKQTRCSSTCFVFCNNQYRILGEGASKNGSDDLATVFESRLVRIVQVVALLDKWQDPEYLKRVWTIYEQFIAAKLGVPLEMILPPEAGASLKIELRKGQDGIDRVKAELSKVETLALQRQLSKQMIEETSSYVAVDTAVKASLVAWMSKEFASDLVTPTMPGSIPRISQKDRKEMAKVLDKETRQNELQVLDEEARKKELQERESTLRAEIDEKIRNLASVMAEQMQLGR